MKKVGNPITHLLTVTKHDLKMYSELEQQVAWEDTAHVVINHLLARCGIGNGMTDVVRKLDMWSAKKTDDISDTNQEYTSMILDLSGLWDDKKRTATTGYTPEATEKWEVDWWSRHMAHNEGEESSEVTRLRANRAQVDQTNRRYMSHTEYQGKYLTHLRPSLGQRTLSMWQSTSCANERDTGFNADRRFNDRDFNTYTSEKIILDNMNMVPAANGTPIGPEPRHKDTVPPVERQQRPNRNATGDRRGNLDTRTGTRTLGTRTIDAETSGRAETIHPIPGHHRRGR